MIRFRNATGDDLELTYQIKLASLKPQVEQIWGWNEDFQRDFHRKDFDPRQIQIILDQEGNCLGLLSSTEDPGSIYIKSILICDFAQDKGIGTRIILDMIEKARLAGKQTKLQVFKNNERAKKLYEKLGFSISGETQQHYQMICNQITYPEAALQTMTASPSKH